MSRQTEIIYDDRDMVNESIEAIVGKRSYGHIIHKKKFLGAIVLETAANANLKAHWIRNDEDLLKINKNLDGYDKNIIYHQARAAVYDETAYLRLLKESSRTTANFSTDPFLVNFAKASEWLNFCDLKNIAKNVQADIVSANSALTDVSKDSELLALLCSDFETRHFNFVKADKYFVVKSSINLDKIRSEYHYFNLLPSEMKSWFIQPFDFEEKDGVGSYRMERLHMTNVSISWLHGAFREREFKNFLNRIFHFLKERPKRKNSDGKKTYDVQIDKIRSRHNDLKKNKLYPELDFMIRSGLDRNGIEGLFSRYEVLSKKILDKKMDLESESISHGDLCFSNILYDKSKNRLHLIDPRGAISEAELWMDSYYDVAKLSHSILGNYDFLAYSQFSIFTDDELQLKLKVHTDAVKNLKSLFLSKLAEEKYDLERVRIIEASLFLSMLSLHTDNFKRILAFVINAKLIMDELEFNNI